MTGSRVVIVETGIANVASVAAAFERLGCRSDVTAERDRVEGAELLVLPGVGAFGAGMSRLRGAGLVGPLVERVEGNRPTLCVCLGMQLLCARSEESPGVEGLGVIDAEVLAFPEGVRRPQFGWNLVRPGGEAPDGTGEPRALVERGYAYFANSFRVREAPGEWRPAYAEHGGPFVAAVERGRVLTCQFHPELSGAWGMALLGRWLERAREGVAC